MIAPSGVQPDVYDASGNLLQRHSVFLGDTVLTQPHGSATVSGVRTYTGAQGIPVAERTATAGVSGSATSPSKTRRPGCRMSPPRRRA